MLSPYQNEHYYTLLKVYQLPLEYLISLIQLGKIYRIVKFISPVGYNLNDVIKQSLKDFLNNKFVVIITISACLLVCMIVFSIWIGIFVVDRLIHLISMSRCILKIIPTIVINNTPDLQNWIENKY